MLIKGRTNYAFDLNPKLSRVWIRTGNSRLPLKSVWMDESKLREFDGEICAAEQDVESDTTDAHLVLAN